MAYGMAFLIHLSSKAVLIAALGLLLVTLDECSQTTLPLGHLEPLGARSPKHSVEVIDAFPSPQEFFESFASRLRPVLIKGGAKISPAFSKWTDEYFIAHKDAGAINVAAEERKKENRTNPSRDLTFREFVETYEEEDIYMVDSVPAFLK